VAAVAPLLSAADAGLIARAKKNLPLGVFTHVYSRFPVAEAARRIRADGFSGVVLEFKFSDVSFDPLAPDWTAAHTIVQAFENAGVRIVALAGYYNIVDPDAAKLKRGEDRMRALLTGWKRFGCPLVCTETGTLNRTSEWLESPENQTERTYAQCHSIVADLTKLAQSTGATLAIEPYWRNVIDTAGAAERLFHDVASSSLKLVMDPCNYYREADLPRMKPMLEEIFRRVGSQAVIAHA
jgi:sugar phosphate isomerase/epimerase